MYPGKKGGKSSRWDASTSGKRSLVVSLFVPFSALLFGSQLYDRLTRCLVVVQGAACDRGVSESEGTLLGLRRFGAEITQSRESFHL